MMARKLPGRCPICGDTMDVTRLHCPACDTTIEGRFELCKFCQLSEEMQSFVEIFLKSRGNIKEVERSLGISYPTVRGRLEAVIKALGYAVEADPVVEEDDRSDKRREILDALARGEISAQEAALRLRQA